MLLLILLPDSLLFANVVVEEEVLVVEVVDKEEVDGVDEKGRYDPPQEVCDCLNLQTDELKIFFHLLEVFVCFAFFFYLLLLKIIIFYTNFLKVEQFCKVFLEFIFYFYYKFLQ